MAQDERSRRDSSSSRIGFDSVQEDPRLEAFEALGAAAAVLDSSGRLVAINRGFRRLTYSMGYLGRDSGIGEKFLDVCALSPGHGSAAMAGVAAGLRRILDAETDSITIDCPSPLGAEAQGCRIIISSLREGERRGAAVLILDLSDRATQEAELERSLSLLRATLEATADGILVV